jgi:hypothetical protein
LFYDGIYAIGSDMVLICADDPPAEAGFLFWPDRSASAQCNLANSVSSQRALVEE